MDKTQKVVQFAANRGLDNQKSYIYAYLMEHRFPHHFKMIGVYMDTTAAGKEHWVGSYWLEWIERVKYDRYSAADRSTLRIWKNAEKKYR